jgi:tetratricopeptide (TPR) repeat protein
MLTITLFLGAGCASDETAKSQLNGGYQALDAHQYDQAIQAADQYLQKNPNGPGSAEAQCLKGRVLEERSEDADRAGNIAVARDDLKAAGDCYKTGLLLSPPAPAARAARQCRLPFRRLRHGGARMAIRLPASANR